MNSPAYYITDVFGQITEAVKNVLQLPVLNYQFGYIIELNETLAQWSKTKEFAEKKYPLIWLAQPFTVQRGTVGTYGIVQDLQLFIINSSSPNLKAAQRMQQNFIPILYPIYNALLVQINLNGAIQYEANRVHTVTDRYYWGEQQQNILNDVVDVLVIGNLQVSINNNSNCILY